MLRSLVCICVYSETVSRKKVSIEYLPHFIRSFDFHRTDFDIVKIFSIKNKIKFTIKFDVINSEVFSVFIVVCPPLVW